MKARRGLAPAIADAVSQFLKVLIFTLEMSRGEIVARLVSRLIEIPAIDLSWDEASHIQVDLTGKYPMFLIPGDKQKSGGDQLLPIAPEFAELLLSVPMEQRTGRVFKIWLRVENAEVDLIHVSATIFMLGTVAGVKVNTESRSGKAKSASAHDFRRSFGERWSVRVMPAAPQQMMRHKDINTTMK